MGLRALAAACLILAVAALPATAANMAMPGMPKSSAAPQTPPKPEIARPTPPKPTIDRQAFYLDLDTGGHRAFVKDIAFTPDGQYLVSGSDDKTIRIWDWQAGVSLRTLRGEIGDGNDGKIFAIAISPDGKTIAAAGYFGPGIGEKPPYGDIRLFDFATGRITGVLKAAQYAVYDLAFSPDGSLLAAGGQDGLVYLWRQDQTAGGWSPDGTLDAQSNRISQVAFAASGTRLIAATADNGVRLWDMATRGDIEPAGRALDLAETALPALAVSADGALFATGGARGDVDVFRAADGGLEQTLPGQGFFVGALSFADGNLAVSCGYHCTDVNRTIVWSLAGQTKIAEHRGHDGTVLASTTSPEGMLVATAGGTAHAIRIFDAASGQERHLLQGRGLPVTAVGVEPKPLSIGWGSQNPCPAREACPEMFGALTQVLELPSAERYFEPPRPAGDEALARAVLSAAGWSLGAARGGGDADLANAVLEVARNGAAVHRIENDATNGFLHAAFTMIDEGKRFITGGSDGTLLEYDSASGAIVGEFTGGHTGEVHAMAALERENLLVTGSADQTLRLWNLATRELIVSLYFDSQDWVAWMPQGYYYASDNGDHRFGWHVNQGADREARFVRAGQLKTFLYSPEMVRRAIILRSAKAAVAEMRPGVEKQLDRLLQRKPPEFDVRIAADQSGARDGFVKVEIVGAKQAETDVAEFAILSNSRNVGDLTTRSVSGDGSITVIEVPVAEGDNAIQITGVNADGYMTERSVTAIGRKKREAQRRGKLYVAVIGVDRYPFLPDACNGRACDLKYPVADATGFLDVIAKRTAPLFSEMETLVLVNRETLATATLAGGGEVLEPDADTIDDQLQDFLDKPGPDDTSIVFIAGHGINIDEDYYFIPTDGQRQDGEKWKRSSLVDWGDIQKAVERAEGTRFMMLDTCHAGNAFNPRLEKDAADARIIVFSATAANNTAQEKAELGHGVFTYTLLEGLRGKAKTSQEGVTLFGLADYVGREVEALTQKRQKPFYYISGVDNLILAQP